MQYSSILVEFWRHQRRYQHSVRSLENQCCQLLTQCGPVQCEDNSAVWASSSLPGSCVARPLVRCSLPEYSASHFCADPGLPSQSSSTELFESSASQEVEPTQIHGRLSIQQSLARNWTAVIRKVPRSRRARSAGTTDAKCSHSIKYSSGPFSPSTEFSLWDLREVLPRPLYGCGEECVVSLVISGARLPSWLSLPQRST